MAYQIKAVIINEDNGKENVYYAVSKTTIMRGFWYERETETV